MENLKHKFEDLKMLRYISLCVEQDDSVVYEKMQEYETCNHIVVLCELEYDRYEGRSYKTYGCIKCGLNQAVLEKDERICNRDEKIMKKYFQKYGYMGYQKIPNVSCNLELAYSITKRIREVYPDITDIDLMQYLKNSLDHIRETKINEARKESRIQRLSLSPKFNKWQASDIES